MKIRISRGWLCGVAGLAIAISADAATDAERLAALEQKYDALSAELERNLFGSVATPIGDSHHGMGPSASKVYNVDQGVSIGGYGEGLYQNFDGDKTDQADFLRAILYVGYKFDEKWVLNTEIEIEHANEAFLEFGYLDYLHSEALKFRVGLLLMPVGLVNELHEPTVFHGARRPDIESKIIPSTWRENGLGFFGDVGALSYKAYVVNGMRAEGFSAGGLRGGRQKGSKAKADDLAGVLRVDLTAAEGVTVGASVYSGNSGQDVGVSAGTTLVEGHLDVRKNGLHVRALAVQAEVDDIAELNRALAIEGTADTAIESIGEELQGFYVELGYDVMNLCESDELAVIPFVRYEEYNTQNKVPAGFMPVSGKYDVDVTTIGVTLKPRDEIVFKVDYQIYDNAADRADDQWNLAAGYVF